MNSDNLTGEMLSNRYEILDKIGTGGMATVYKAKDTLLNRYVAVKVLRDSLEEEKGIVANFIKEAQSSASLVHNNIVSVYDVGEQDGVNYMVMEYVDGITLKEYIKTRGALPWQEACDFAIQIGQGINEAHAINIVHRDIKPQNILMTKDKILKVTDFGIAKAMAGETTVVAGGNVLGSVHYISPEQARGGMTDARSDIYSLGVVLYEMLAGKVPFDGDTAVSVALMHLEKEPVNVKAVNLDIPADLAYVTMKAMSKEQNARYQSVTELMEDLHAVLADEPLPSREGYYEDIDEEDDVAGDFDEGDDEDYIEEEVIPVKKADKQQEQQTENRGRNNRSKQAQKKTKSKKKENVVSAVLAIVTVLVIVLIGIGVFFGCSQSKEVQMPDLVNMTLEEAKEKASEAGVSIAEAREMSYSDTVEKDHIISQDPTAGTTVKRNSEVKLVVSLGASGGNISTPNVVNTPYEEAIAAILEAGLNYEVVEEPSNTIQIGYVIRQIPFAGTKLMPDDPVTIHISTGPSQNTEATPVGKQVSVPDIVGLSQEAAENTLSANGLRVGTVSRDFSTASKGQVISQSPDVGSKVMEGAYVSIVVSRGETAPAEPQVTEAPQVQEPTQSNTEPEPETPTYTEERDTNSGGGDSGSSGGTSTRSFSVRIPENVEGDTVDVEITLNGRTVYSATHSKDEGVVQVDLEGSGTANVQAYINDSKVSDKTISFD